MEKFPNKKPSKYNVLEHFAESSLPGEKDLGLLRALSPSTARIYKELQGKHLSGKEFFDRISKYNDERKAHNHWLRPGHQVINSDNSIHSVYTEISPTRKLRVDFTRAGYVDVQGADYYTKN